MKGSRIMSKHLAAAAVALVTIVPIAAPEAAAYSRSQRGGETGYVTAESRWGHGSISAPVRPSRTGAEVRLPGGTWVPCARSCAETLRQETVDFWEARGPQMDKGPGYFSFGFRY